MLPEPVLLVTNECDGRAETGKDHESKKSRRWRLGSPAARHGKCRPV